MPISQNDTLPEATLMIAREDGAEQVSASAFFAGKKTALFAVPGAFTPTCSAKHLPGFVEKAAELKAKGMDQIVCLSVNDAFVMNAWGKSANAGDDVVMLADGNGEFTRALGLEMDGSAYGMGMRAQRFSAIIDDNKVTTLNIEEPGAFDVSSADHMLGQLS